MTDWLSMTPREAMLEAELKHVRAKFKWACAAGGIDEETMQVTGMIRDDGLGFPPERMPDRLSMPMTAAVRGVLGRGGRYTVVARTHGEPENMEVVQYAEGPMLASKYAAYDTLTDLHRRFVLVLADKLKDQR